MFFDDFETEPRRRKMTDIRVPPMTPETGWRPPAQFPNLSAAKLISFDVETKETDFDNGPGWARGKGNIVGLAVGAEDSLGNIGKWYFPIRHEVEPEYNLDSRNVFNWARDYLERTPHIPKVGANLIYDVGWLGEEEIKVQGELHDVQFAEALLTEDGETNLEYLGVKYLNEGKISDQMYQWQAAAFGGSVNDRQRANIYRTSPRLVGPYAESDCDLPIRVLRAQWSKLQTGRLLDVYRMENDLIYLLVMMRRKGIRVDLRAAEQLYTKLGIDIQNLNRILRDQMGFDVNVNAGASLAKVFDALGLPYPKTEAGAPSFTKDFLKMVDHPIALQIMDIRAQEKIRGTFIKSYILESHSNGYIHCNFHPLRGQDGGARSGRFASAIPNLQNIPVRPNYVEEQTIKAIERDHGKAAAKAYPTLGMQMRGMFIADEGHSCIEKNDYSQIEYRFLTHFAVGGGSDEVRAQFNSDPNTDYHVFTQELVKSKTGTFIERKPIKNINFGLLYGMGEKKLARQLGVDKDKARSIFDAYHGGAPYVKATMDLTAAEAGQLGYVETIFGRRSYFDLWEPLREGFQSERKIGLPIEQAIQRYGSRLQRAYLHKAINRRLQGSAADKMKVAMWRCWKEGVFDAIGVPRLTVHDELVFSVMDESPFQNEAYAYMHHVMETAIPLKIPVVVDSGRGANWGAIE